MNQATWSLAGALALGALHGCGGQAVVDGGETSATAGSGGGSGGAGATASAASTSGAGGAARTCGGKQGLECGQTEWCKYDAPGTCGNADGTGTCQPRPTSCGADCRGACGCDGKIDYCNDCEVHAAGFDVSTVCGGPH